jgi:hypothetical protein
MYENTMNQTTGDGDINQWYVVTLLSACWLHVSTSLVSLFFFSMHEENKWHLISFSMQILN